MKGNLGNLLKQAQQMQSKMQEAQEQLANMVVTGEAGAGLVRVEMNGRHDVKRFFIDDSLINVSEKEVLEDLLAAAVNDAVRKVEKASREKLNNVTAGIQLPPGFDVPGDDDK